MKASRLHSLDAMRAIMVLLGIVLHLSLVFATFSNPFKLNSNSGHFIFDIMYAYTHYFRMPAFFMLSGFFSSLLYYNKSPKKMLLNRFKRIFLPLVVFIYPLWIFNAYARQTSILQNEGLSPFNALIDGFKVFNKTEALIPWITIHLWFLYLLFFMSISVFIAKKIFNRDNILNKKFKQIISLVFLKPWLGSFLLALIYGLFMSFLNKLEAQGGGQWWSWVWFIDLAAFKTFLAFSFFYFTGWSIYRLRSHLTQLDLKRQFIILALSKILIFFCLYILFRFGFGSPYEGLNNTFLNSKRELDKSVTFNIDMTEFDWSQFKDKNNEFRGVFLQGDFNGWCGECDNQMSDENGDLIFTKTIDIRSGFHNFVFSINGWDGANEAINKGQNEKWISPGQKGLDCDSQPQSDQNNNYQILVQDKDLFLNPICWKKCADCNGNIISDINIRGDKAQLKDIINKVFIIVVNFGVPITVLFYLALFLHFFNEKSKFWRYVSDSSYWVYLIHLPLVYFISGFFHNSSLNIFLKFSIILILITFVCFSTYHFFVRRTFIGQFLNGRKYD